MSAVTAGAAAACAICLAAVGLTPGQRFDDAAQAVLATASADGKTWQILATLKAEEQPDLDELTAGVPPEGPTPEGRAALLVHSGLGHLWTSMGVVDLAYSDWLARYARSPSPDDLSDDPAWQAAAWQARLALVAPQLESPDPAIAELAHGELGRAPYTAILELGRSLEAGELIRLLADETLPTRRGAYILMLGVTGDPDAARWGDACLSPPLAGATPELAATLAAKLELEGPAFVERIETDHLLDPRASPEVIEAALLALDVHGDTDATIPRARVVSAYRRFIVERPAMAGFVAPDLARWEEWGATADYVALINAAAIADPAGDFAVLTCLDLSPDTAAKSRLEPYHD